MGINKARKIVINCSGVAHFKNVDLWKRDNGTYAVRYAGDERTEYFTNFKKAVRFAQEQEQITYARM